MKPIEFSGQNVVFAEDQPEYLQLPAFKDERGEVVSCWGLSWREFFKLLLIRRVWVMTLTFNQPLQPLAVSVDCPFIEEPS